MGGILICAFPFSSETQSARSPEVHELPPRTTLNFDTLIVLLNHKFPALAFSRDISNEDWCVANIHDDPAALKALQDDIYRERILRARKMTVEMSLNSRTKCLA